jgi:hypothetical protein
MNLLKWISLKKRNLFEYCQTQAKISKLEFESSFFKIKFHFLSYFVKTCH